MDRIMSYGNAKYLVRGWWIIGAVALILLGVAL